MSLFLQGCNTIFEDNSIVTEESGFAIRCILSLSPHPNSNFIQGMAVHNNYAFIFYTYGYCKIIDLTNKKELYQTQLESQSKNNHANNAAFSKIYYEDGDILPLIYISPIYPKNTCYVERFDIEHNSFQLIQTIIFQDNPNTDTRCSFTVDEESNYIYRLSYEGNNKLDVICYMLPDCNQSIKTLTDKDILYNYSFSFDSMPAWQGCCIHKGVLFALWGGTDSKRFLAEIDLKTFECKLNEFTSLFPSEPESIAVWGDMLIISSNFPCGIWNFKYL